MVKSNKLQTGFTLIELMIALFLGIFVVGGIYSVLVGNTGTFVTVQSTSKMHEDARVGMLFLRKQFHMAGYRSEQDIQAMLDSLSPIFAAETLGGYTFSAAQVITGTDGASSSQSDKVVLRYRGIGLVTDDVDSTFDCAGEQLEQGDMARVEYSVNSDNELVCRDYDVSLNAFGSEVVILEDVELFKIMYHNGDKYVSAANAGDFSSINSVRFALVIRGDKNSGVINNRTYSIFGTDYDPTNDGFPREVFQTSVILYNNAIVLQ